MLNSLPIKSQLQLVLNAQFSNCPLFVSGSSPMRRALAMLGEVSVVGLTESFDDAVVLLVRSRVTKGPALTMHPAFVNFVCASRYNTHTTVTDSSCSALTKSIPCPTRLYRHWNLDGTQLCLHTQRQRRSGSLPKKVE